jgi:hypothetical protein
VSKAAIRNPERRRELREIPLPDEIVQICEPGTKAYLYGGCRVLISRQQVGWHLSISRTNKLPSWEEVRDIRYALIPDEAVMAMILPPKSEYVNVHEFCFQLYEIPAEYLSKKQDRL